jgi:predicted ATPase
VFCFCFVSHALWHLGYPDLSRKRIHQALTLAEQLAHPYSRALAFDYAAMLYQFRREGDMSQALAEAAITLCRDHGFAYYLAWGTIVQGWALAAQGQRETGMAQMNHSLAAIEATGAKLRQPYYRALLSAAYRHTGQVEEGLAILDAALSGAHKTEERWSEAELYRLEGALLLTQSSGNKSEAETCFQQALNIAQRQEAKSLELRAAMSLARLWQSQGKRQDAYDLLAPVYGWFTEGFDTADLQDAKAMLLELA